MPWDDNDVVDVHGNYLGTIFPNNRLFKVIYKPYRGYPGYLGYPGYAGYPGYPGYSPIPANAADVDLESRR